MKRRRRSKAAPFLKLALLFAVFALILRFVADSKLESKVSGLVSESFDEDFLRYAISEETQLVEKNEEKKLLKSFVSETGYDFSEEEPKKEEKKDFIEKELEIWTFTPGGERSKDTYPIENITISPKSAKGYVTYDGIFVKNDSTKGIDLKWLLSAKLPFKLTGNGPHVLIVHTHGSESYLPVGDTYKLTDIERTEDTRYNVVRVGDELEEKFKSCGISVIHDRSIYDSPSYNGSYTRALDAIGKALKKYPSIKVVVDVHRDAMTTDEGIKYRTVADVNGKQVAQMMLVMSTGESGLPHADWAENLKLAVKLQNAMAKKYPGVMRPINLRKERFNMHATKGSMLVEVGTSANTLDEACAAVKLLGGELAEILKTAK